MTPSTKSPDMEAAITKIFGVDRRAQIYANVCATCGKPAIKFKDELSRKEFSISGMCQKCQDSIFG